MTTYPLRHVRLRPGEELRETVEVPVEAFTLGGQSYVPVPALVGVELSIQRATSGDVFRIVLDLGVTGPCMRCLADASARVEIDTREYQAADPGAGPELRTEYVTDGELLIGDWVRDQVVLALPAQILCRPDCAGLCGVCGKDLNAEPHTHADETVDARWAALEALRVNGDPDAS